MAIKDIRIWADPALRQKCEDVDIFDGSTKILVNDLLETVKLPGRAGLAANQIGVLKRAFSYNVEAKVSYILNPEIIDFSGEPELMGEGCLSLPDLWSEVMRYPRVTISGFDLQAKKIIIEASGLLAQVFQHECDHLDGMVYMQKLDIERKKKILKEIREANW